MRQRAVVFSGYSNSGKTTLICRLIEELSRRGIVTGAIKHTHHPVTATDDGDTGRFLRAGASQVILAGEGEAVLFRAWDSATENRESVRTGKEASAPGIAGLAPPAGAQRFSTTSFVWTRPSELPEMLDSPLILIEGFKNAGTWPRIIVADPEGRFPPPDPTVIALAGGRVPFPGLPRFERDDVKGLAGFLDRILWS